MAGVGGPGCGHLPAPQLRRVLHPGGRLTESGLDDVYKAAYQTYHASELGVGEDRDGIFVLLSMAERDYAMFVYRRLRGVRLQQIRAAPLP